MSSLNRRDFLRTAGVAAVVISLPVLQQARGDAPAKTGKPVAIGKLTDYAKDGVTEKWSSKPNSFFVVRKDGKLYACSSLCTHKFFKLTVKKDEFYCTKHKSEFTLDGSVTTGPAKDSLPRYKITTDDKDVISVDTATEFSESKWDDADSFVKIEK